jgi:glycine oxidase
MNVVIIGGGVIGCAIGLRLAQAGAEVTVLEKSLPGAEASSAAAGILGAQAESGGDGPFFRMCLESRARYAAFAEELESLSGIAIGYRRCGLLDVALDEEAAQSLETLAAAQRALGLKAELLSDDQVRSLEPALAPGVARVAHFPDDAQVDNRLLVQALSVAAARANVRFRTGAVRGVLRDGDRAVGVDLDGERLGADAVVVAAGAWTGLVTGIGLDAQAVRPARGQMLMLQTRAPLLSRIVFAKGRYLVPRPDGRLIVGSTLEFGGYDKRVTAQGLSSLLAFALERCPALKDATVVETWAGLRPYTDDHLPILGKGPLEGLFLASGHFRNGILLTPITADVMADCVMGRPLSVDLGPYGWERLAASPPAR